MARRSRKTLQTEGQLSLFAMTDDFLFAEKVAELKASGETESYLEQIETAYRNRISELTPGCMKSCGATPELRSSDLPSFIKKANSAEAMATEIAIKEIVEAM